MARRMQSLGHGWADALASQAYTVHDIGALVGPEIVQHGAAAAGLTWHFTRPPIVDLEVEIEDWRTIHDQNGKLLRRSSIDWVETNNGVAHF